MSETEFKIDALKVKLKELLINFESDTGIRFDELKVYHYGCTDRPNPNKISGINIKVYL